METVSDGLARVACQHAFHRQGGKTCPGAQHPDHVTHGSINGSEPGVALVSKHAGRYPPAFVRAAVRTVKELSAKALRLHSDNVGC